VGAAKPSPGTAHGVGAALRDAIAEAIGLSATDIEDDAPFGALGLDSVAAMEVAERLAARTGRRVPLHLFGDHPTPAALARHLDGRDAAPAASPISPAVAFAPATTAPAQSALPRHGAAAGDAIAITGMAGRFPGAPDLSTFWSLLLEGRSALGPVPEGRWAEAEFAGLAPGLDPARLGCGGFLADAESFDAAFFGLSPREAMAMDPQQRLLLEETWNALADAGLAAAPAEARQRTGVWVGAGTGDWPLKLALSGQAPDRVSLVGQLGGSLASRVAHAFGLQGPAVTLDTACASAVAALAAAAAALRRGEVDIAVAAAVAVMATPQLPALAEAAGLLSASGRCAALTPAADGMLLGEGVGVLVLRRLEDALAAGETTHAVLSAARMGHDGGGSLGISTPSAAGQARLARRRSTGWRRMASEPRPATPPNSPPPGRCWDVPARHPDRCPWAP
jgi:3-oxoacyl-(acyl-carrier-protein) synthase/aryl carrier-like protein